MYGSSLFSVQKYSLTENMGGSMMRWYDMKVRYSLIRLLLRYDSAYVYVMNIVIHFCMIVDYDGI